MTTNTPPSPSPPRVRYSGTWLSYCYEPLMISESLDAGVRELLRPCARPWCGHCGVQAVHVTPTQFHSFDSLVLQSVLSGRGYEWLRALRFGSFLMLARSVSCRHFGLLRCLFESQHNARYWNCARTQSNPQAFPPPLPFGIPHCGVADGHRRAALEQV